MAAMTIPDDAITAAGNAMRKLWLAEYPTLGRLPIDPMDWAEVALEAAAPLIVNHREATTAHAIAKAERERIGHVIDATYGPTLAAQLKAALLPGEDT